MSTDSTDAPIREGDCIICGKWPENNRWALREMTIALPLQKIDQICDPCLSEFWSKFVSSDPKSVK